MPLIMKNLFKFLCYSFLSFILLSCSSGSAISKVNTIPFQLEIVPLQIKANLPALHQAYIYPIDNKWLIMGGSTATMHNFW